MYYYQKYQSKRRKKSTLNKELKKLEESYLNDSLGGINPHPAKSNKLNSKTSQAIIQQEMEQKKEEIILKFTKEAEQAEEGQDEGRKKTYI